MDANKVDREDGRNENAKNENANFDTDISRRTLLGAMGIGGLLTVLKPTSAQETGSNLWARLCSGELARRPTAGVRGRYYHAYDTGHLFVDDGYSWSLVDFGARSVSTEQLNTTVYLGGEGYSTLDDALSALPAEGGTIHLAETVTETSNVTVDKPVKIVGAGFPYSQNATAYIDLNGNTVHVTERAQTWEKLQMVGGNVIIGEHDQYGGRHHIELCVRESPGDSIEFRGGFMDCVFDIKSHQAGDRGVVWNLDCDGVDYFNQSETNILVHSATNESVVITGIGTGISEFEGNVFNRFEVEAGGGTGFVVDDAVSLKSNKFFGYGVHDGGVDIRPAEYNGNIIWWAVLRDGGHLDIGGVVHAKDAGYLRDITTDVNTEIRLSGHTSFIEAEEETRTKQWSHPDYGQTESTINALSVGTETVTLGDVQRSASLTIHGENASDGTVSFIDRVDVIAFGPVTVVSETERNTPAARTYSTSGGDLEMSMASGSYEIHVEKFKSGQK